jgi:diguanylate cyclase (GGDEF)-like protein
VTSHHGHGALHALETWGEDHIAHAPRKVIYPLLAIVLALGAPIGLFAVRSFAGMGGRSLREALLREVTRDALTYGYLLVSTTLVFAIVARAIGAFVDRLYELSITDPLTGMFNRRYFDARLDAELGRAHRYGADLAMVFIDVDHLKDINDRYGHGTGDLVIMHAAQTIAQNQRQCDVAARIGGDELAVMLPETSAAEAVIFAERVRTGISRVPVPGTDRTITVSIGISQLDQRSAADPHVLVGDADLALYLAKSSGRDRVIVAPAMRDAYLTTSAPPTRQRA